jgi:choline-sulfatase
MLVIMSDQHNKHVTGCYGNPVVSTPNMDRLASQGVRFDSAYCPFPLCAPSRMAFMTGREPSEIGAYDNRSVLDSNVPTFAHALGRQGYETVLCGRMHFNGPDQRHGFQSRIFPEVSSNATGTLTGTTGFLRTGIEKSDPGRNHYLLYDRECVGQAVRWIRDRHRSGPDQPFMMVVGLVGPHCTGVALTNLS